MSKESSSAHPNAPKTKIIQPICEGFQPQPGNTKGYQPAVPTGTRWACFLNKVDDSRLKSAEAVGNRLLAAGVPEVVFGQASRANECFYRMRRLPD